MANLEAFHRVISSSIHLFISKECDPMSMFILWIIFATSLLSTIKYHFEAPSALKWKKNRNFKKTCVFLKLILASLNSQ